jgi:hypothetical protein
MNRALLVGINNYPPPNQLNGCDNDISDMSDFLTSSCNFASSDIRLLADDRATKAAIVDRLTWLVAGIRAGDRVLFHYSGHGAQLPIRNTQGNVSEIHDTICPVDFNFTRETSITDTDFKSIFSGVPPGVEFIWISDSCYSGGLLKGIRRPTSRIKTFEIPIDIAWRIRTAKDSNIQTQQIGKSISNTNVALLSGCTASQESEDAVFNNRYNGALTYSLLLELKGADGLKENLTTVVANINTFLAKNQYAQTPLLEGNAAIQVKAFMSVNP